MSDQEIILWNKVLGVRIGDLVKFTRRNVWFFGKVDLIVKLEQHEELYGVEVHLKHLVKGIVIETRTGCVESLSNLVPIEKLEDNDWSAWNE